MKIVIVGANGTIGKYVTKALEGAGRELVRVGKTSGDYQVDMAKPESITALLSKIGKFDALVCVSGEVTFAPFQSITRENWLSSFQSKLLGQISLVQQGLPFINEGGSFTLVSGILSDEFIAAGVAATTVNRALEGFVQASAAVMPRGVRINVVSPNLLKDSAKAYEDFFPGFVPVEGSVVGQAFKRAVLGVETGKIYRVF